MFNTILVPLDGSQLADCVLPHVIAIARSFDSEVTLLRMLEKTQAGTSAQLFDLVNWQINKTRATLYLEKIKARFQREKTRAQTAVIEGLVADGITEYAHSHGIKLIVLSSHGRNGLTRWGISSITQKIIMSAQTSLLIVRAHQDGIHSDELSEKLLYKRILVPLDGSQRAENVLPIVTQLAQFHRSQIHLVQIIQTPEMARQMPPTREDVDLSNRIVSRNQEEAGRYLEQLKSRSFLEGLTIQIHLITSDNTAVALHQLVEQENIDMVALSAHGYSGIHQWPYGSMVNNFVQYGKVPLLIVQDLPAKLDLASSDTQSSDRAER
ncbi:universal stress protein [Candidatus Villigracilis saccharophilus]|uniref:universal stress protein n=1 Tax=Candidatus Villigracilis saccharophilus TaxID=3140684 RepID=UPI0031361779|nr:universal stress protein [Anaerolineales bacterium]